jgi:hypothetical protein
MKVRLIEAQKTPYGEDLPIGTEIEHEDVHFLVGVGVAEPIDDECHAKVAELAKRAKIARIKPKPKITKPGDAQKAVQKPVPTTLGPSDAPTAATPPAAK